MKKTLVAISCVAAIGFSASIADAQCAFDISGKNGKLISNFVRSYAGCGNSVTFSAPNSVSQSGVPSCSPPFVHSPYQWGPKGFCQTKIQAKLEDPCSDGSGVACANFLVSGKCANILESDGITPINGPQTWRLQTISRATFDDKINGDMTVIDFPAVFDFGEPKKGGMKIKANSNDLLNGLFGPGSALPGCTQLAVVSLSILDANGQVFAVQGGGSPGL